MEERLPEEDEYVLMSFENFTLPIIGRYEKDNDGGGAWYIGDDDGCDTCSSQNLFVNAWMPLPESYRPDEEEMFIRRVNGDLIRKQCFRKIFRSLPGK